MWRPINRKISQRVTPWLAAARLTPNQVTMLSLGAGLLGVLDFLRGTPAGWIQGALWLQLSYVLDNCDGELARMTGTASGLGSWLDTLADCLIHTVFFPALGAGFYRFDPNPLWLLLGGLASAGVLLSYGSSVLEQIQLRGRAALEHPDPPPDQGSSGIRKAIKIFREDFSFIVLASALLGQMAWLLWSGLFGAFFVGISFLASIVARAARSASARRVPVARLAGFLVGAGLFVWVLRSVDLAAVWRQLQGMSWQFGWILAFYALIFSLDTLGWHFALDTRVRSRIRWDRLFRARLAGEALNYVTPAASIGGEPVKAHLLSKRYGVSLPEGMASVVVAKTTLTLSMLLFIGVGLGVALMTQPVTASTALLLKWVWATFAVLSVLLGLFLAVQFFQPFARGFRLFQWLIPIRLRRWGVRFQEWDQAIVRLYRESPRALLGSITFHFLGWMAGVLEVYLILHFLKIPVSVSTAWSVEAMWVLLRSGAFMIPASLGASEGFLLLICSGLGISAVSGLALGLVRRARELTWVGLGLVEVSRG